MNKIILGLVLLFSVGAFAQAGKVNRAEKKFEKYRYIDAQEIYLRVAEKGYESADLFRKIGDTYYLNADYVKANEWYGKLFSKYPDSTDAERHFRYAQSLKAVKDYEGSDKIMKQFVSLKTNDKRAKLFEESPEYLRDIDFRKGSYEVEKIGINSMYSDFGPMLYEQKLIFASARDTGVFVKRIYKWNEQPFLDLYEVNIDEIDAGVKPKKFDKDLNTRYHESSPAFTKDGNTVYFTRNNFNNGKYREDNDGINKLKIYRATKDSEGVWGEAQELSFCSDDYTVAHPTLSVDDKRLYFSSDMPGTLGMADLWVVTINEDGSFGTPQNLGGEINTEARESFPFISESNDLYFASNGHPGLGGLDLFITAINEEGKVAEIINLGEPANSPFDDFAFVIDESTETGFLSSNRGNPVSTDDDIYRFKQLEKPEPPCEIVLSGVVTDKDSGATLDNALVSLYDTNGNLVKAVTTQSAATYAFLPECDKQFAIRAQKEGYLPFEKLITTPAISSSMDEPLQLELVKKPFVPGDDIGKVLDLNPIYFDFDKHNIRPDAAIELAKVVAVMETYPDMRIDVRSHTDSRGVDAYNMRLSERRNQSTIDYIIAKGISASRLTGRGYGESRLINNCSNGTPCSEKAHQLNRRSEFIVLGN